jgi:DNA-directed RNA polymerase specialized sigma24 family protein
MGGVAVTSLPFQGEDFGVIYDEYVKDRRSFDELLVHPKFQRRLRQLVYKYNFRSFHMVYGPEDLYGDSILKVKVSAHLLLKPNNVRGEDEFFDYWLPMVVHGVFCSSDRRLNRARRNKVQRAEEPAEELSLPAPPDDHDRKYLLNLFRKSIRYEPEKKRRAIELWLEDYSFREIEVALYGEGSVVSYTTIRNWVKRSIRTFKSELMRRSDDLKVERIRREACFGEGEAQSPLEIAKRRSRGGAGT